MTKKSETCIKRIFDLDASIHDVADDLDNVQSDFALDDDLWDFANSLGCWSRETNPYKARKKAQIMLENAQTCLEEASSYLGKLVAQIGKEED